MNNWMEECHKNRKEVIKLQLKENEKSFNGVELIKELIIKELQK